MKTQTLIYDSAWALLIRLDDILYQPGDVIIIDGKEYQEWNIADEFEEYLVRKICLKD